MMTTTNPFEADLKVRSTTLPSLLLVDHGANLGAELFLHPLHRGIGQSTAARTSAIGWTRSCRLPPCLCCSAYDLDLHRPVGGLAQRGLNNALRLGAKCDINQHLRDSDFYDDLGAAQRPLTF